MEYKFLQCEDGIYFAKPLENGLISNDNIYKINDEDIVTLFLNYLKRYCVESKKNILEIVDDNNNTLMEAKLYIAAFNNLNI